MLAFAAFLLTSCLLDPDSGAKAPRAWDGSPGSVKLDLKLDRNDNFALGKVSSADTTFGLDSLIVVLTATGAETRTLRYPISGYADTGVITLASFVVDTLNPLLNWKARFYTIDTTLTPVRRDTVHIDSVMFAVLPADTAVVSMTVSAAFSILRTRFISSTRDSIGAGIRYIRLKVDGITRDSVALLGGTYNSVALGDQATSWIVNDTGRIFKSIDSGKTWFPRASGTLANLHSVTAVNATTAWAVGDGGVIVATTDGDIWTPQASGTTRRLNRIFFTSASIGYIVGDSGLVLKTTNGGTLWSPGTGGWARKTSGVATTLYDIWFTSATTGHSVGAGGVLRRTLDNGNTWSLMTSPTVQDYNAVHFASASAGYVVGNAGQVAKYNGTSWSSQTSNASQALRGVHSRHADSTWAVGDSETVVRTMNGTNWQNKTGGWLPHSSGTGNALNATRFASGAIGWAVGATGTIIRSADSAKTWSAPQTSGTTRNLNGTWFTTTTAGIAVGDSETVRRTADGGATAWLGPAPSGWTAFSSGITNRINSVTFANWARGWVAADSGKILRTVDHGASWTIQPLATAKKKPIRSIYAASANNVLAVGDSGQTFLTSNGGGTWTFTQIATGVTNNLRGVWSNTGFNRFITVGATGTIRRSTNGTTWASQTSSTTNNLNAVHSNGTYVWAVGDGGVTRYRADLNSGSYTTPSGTISGSPNLNGVYCISSTNVIVVGVGGRIFKTTNTGTSWVQKGSGVTASDLHSVFFRGTTDTGYAAGTGGVVLKTVDQGENWVAMPTTTTTPDTIFGVFLRPTTQDTVFVVGGSGRIRRSLAGGNWSNKSTQQKLNAVANYSTTIAFAVGDSGTILRSYNTGANWRPAPASGITKHLNAVFSNGTRIWAVGNDGTLIRSTNSTPTWTTAATGVTTKLNGVYFTDNSVGYIVGDGGKIYKTSVTQNNAWTLQGDNVTTQNLRHVFFSTVDTGRGWIVGDNGTILRTTNGGVDWTLQASSTSHALRGVHVTNDTIAYTVGAAGTVLRTVKRGELASGKGTRQTFRAVHFVDAATGFIMGDSGVIVKTTNAGETWVPQTSGTTNRLNGAHFFSASIGWVVGNTGTILKTVNGGTDWTLQTVGSAHLTRVRFSDANNGWISGASGVILRTTDGGDNWIAQASGETAALNGIHALNADTGYVVGNNGILRKYVPPAVVQVGKSNLKGVYGRNDSLYVVGDSARAYRSRDAGASWVQLTGPTQPLNSVFTTVTGVIAVGKSGHIVTIGHTVADNVVAMDVRTSNTAKELFAVMGTPTSAPNKVFAMGDSGMILLLTGGITGTWSTLTGNANQLFRAAHCLGVPMQHHCLIVGDNETVMRISASGESWNLVSSGAKIMDRLLTYKYFRPGVSHEVILQAIDRTNPLRGYEKIMDITAGAGQDLTVDVEVNRCGYPDTPDCSE